MSTPRQRRGRIFAGAIVLAACLSATVLHAHPSPVGLVEIDEWVMPNIARTLTAGYADSLGLYALPRHGFPRVKTIDGRRCVAGSALMFDVDDRFAFDIDETVELELLFHRSGTTGLSYSYDRNAQAEAVGIITIDTSGPTWHSERLVLERARFANRGQGHSDLILVASGAIIPVQSDASNIFTLCNIALKRSHTTPPPAGDGAVDFSFIDAKSSAGTPVRLGIYDATGRMPLPSDDALMLKIYDEPYNQLVLRDAGPNSSAWPSTNRYVFYADGRYRANLPAGDYELIASKGPEYRVVRLPFTVEANVVLKKRVALSRWDNLPKAGWYSGDAHIHITRHASENSPIAALLAAEDVHVSNLLAMTNTTTRHFDQYAWGEAGQFRRGLHNIVPGIEGPRTAHLGHTISLNIGKPLDKSLDYFHYHKAFEAYAEQGALSGFAHVGLGEFYEWRGLALEVPFGTVDFVEVMQFSALHTEIWYNFLNLGFQLTPVSGSDFPYFNQPGAERTYANVLGKFTPQGWYDALAAGRVFVSNGPMLTFTIDDQPMGATIDAAPGQALVVSASVRINPDIDRLDRLELVKYGEVIASVVADGDATELVLDQTVIVDEGMWLAVRAYGKARGLAHSSPIYVHLGKHGSWSCDKAPATLERIHSWLDEIESPIAIERELEFWEVENMAALWEQQRPNLLKRLNKARTLYKTLSKTIQEQSE